MKNRTKDQQPSSLELNLYRYGKSVRDCTEDICDTVRDRGARIVGESLAFVRENPGSVMVGVVGLGLVLGLSVPRGAAMAENRRQPGLGLASSLLKAWRSWGKSLRSK